MSLCDRGVEVPRKVRENSPTQGVVKVWYESALRQPPSPLSYSNCFPSSSITPLNFSFISFTCSPSCRRLLSPPAIFAFSFLCSLTFYLAFTTDLFVLFVLALKYAKRRKRSIVPYPLVVMHCVASHSVAQHRRGPRI